MSADSIARIDAQMKEADSWVRSNPPDWEKAALCWKKAWDGMGASDVRAPGCLFRATYCYLQTNLEDRAAKKRQWTRQIESGLDHLAWMKGCDAKRQALGQCSFGIRNLDNSDLYLELYELIQGPRSSAWSYAGMPDESSKW